MKRSLHTPPFTRPDSKPEHPVPVSPPPVAALHPCVQPRRRFIIQFLTVCLSLTVVGAVIAINRFETPENVPERLLHSVLFPVSLLVWLVPAVYLPLLMKSQTKRGSLLQLIGLILPLLVAVASCSLCWSNRLYALAFSMSVVWLGLGGALFFLLPGYLLHHLLAFLETRTSRRE